MQHAEASFHRAGQEKAGRMIDEDTVQLAKVAIKERSPSYVGNKLVSQVGMQSDAFDVKQATGGNRVEDEKVKAELNMHVLQNTLKQRQEWRKQYNLDDKELFEAFSEFSAMMVLNRQKLNENNPASLKNRVEAATVGKDYLSAVFPVTTSSRKYN